MPLPPALVPLGTASAVAAMFGVSGCGSAFTNPGQTTTQQREISASVTRVELGTSGDLIIEQGDAPTLEITAGENDLEYLASAVSGDTLVLATTSSRALGSFQYRLVVRSLDSVEVAGSGDVTASSASADTLDVAVDGSGDVRVDGVDVQELTADISGSGDIEVSGTTDSQRVGIEGSGDFRGTHLSSRTATVVVEGSGDVEVDVADTLEVRIAGSGSVRYTGSPEVKQTISGSGDVEQG